MVEASVTILGDTVELVERDDRRGDGLERGDARETVKLLWRGDTTEIGIGGKFLGE